MPGTQKVKSRAVVERLTERMHHPGDRIIVHPGYEATIVAVNLGNVLPYTIVYSNPKIGESHIEISSSQILYSRC